jgi:hypothetical protein
MPRSRAKWFRVPNGSVVVLAEDVDVDPKTTSFLGELFRRGRLVSRPRVDQEEA